MGTVNKEVDDIKSAEMEKLNSVCIVKVEVWETMKRSQSEQNLKIQEFSSKIDKLTQELYEKEAIIEQISSANDNTKIIDQAKEISLLKQEIEGLKGRVSVSSHEKLSEAEEKAESSNATIDDVLLSLEEEQRIIEEQLYQKTEQFNLLEEAHEKLCHLFEAKEKLWEKERDLLLDEILELQEKVNSPELFQDDRVACEERKRKYLEVELANILAKYEESQSKLESLAKERDHEVASLWDLLGAKEMVYKENEYQLRRIEQENQELVVMLKEFQESGISSSSSLKYRNKLRALEKVHQECLPKLKRKEFEWNTRTENLLEDLVGCKVELECKNIIIKELKKDLEKVNKDCVSDSLILENEETSMMLLILRSEFLEYLENYGDMDLKRDSRILLDALERANSDLAEKSCDINIIEYEVEIWKSYVEQLKASLVENRKMRKQVEASLLADSEIENNLKHEKLNLIHVIEEKDMTIHRLKEQLNKLKDELYTRNLEIVSQKVKETSSISDQIVDNRDQRIEDLRQLFGSLEQEFNTSAGSFETTLSEMKMDIKWFREAWEKIKHVAIVKEIEIQESNMMISELENVISDFQENMEKTTMISEEKGEVLEAENSLNDMKEELVVRIGMLCGEDMQLMKSIASMVRNYDTDKLKIELKKNDEFFNPIKENIEIYHSPVSKKVVV